MRRALTAGLLLAIAATLAACGAGRTFARGHEAAKLGDWEAAVGFYRQALQDDPDRPDYKIALERAMLSAAQMYVQRGRDFEAAGQPEEALRAYRKALEFEPGNRTVASKAAEIERMLRDKLEASRPRPEIERMQEQARQASAEPVLNPTSREPLNINFNNTSVRDILNFIGSFTGINVSYDRDFQDRSISVKLDGLTLEQALQQIMIANQYFYKVLNERTIIVAQDTTQKRTQYEEQVIRTFFVSHSDANELATLLNGVIRVAGQAIQPTIVANKTSNTITIRGTSPVVAIAERIIGANDKPRAEVIVDVQILEVSRERAKQYGLNLTDYAMGLIFSPEVSPSGAGGGTGAPSGGLAPGNVGSPPPFNLNTISTGVSTADFYLAVPAAIIRFLESDSSTKVLAKPQLRGAEGQKLTLNLGEDVPVPSTTFTPLATGGAAANPLTSYGYRTIGIIVEMEPRVTYDGDVILNISVENSARGQDTNIAGQNLPSFFSRKVVTRLRLRDGESNLLAGLLREDERRSLRGFPGVMRLPVIRQLFSSNDEQIRTTDIVMLLTPRIIRSHELKAADLSPIYVGTQANMSLGGGPPPAIFSVGVEGPGGPTGASGPSGASGASGASGPGGATGASGATGALGVPSTTPITPVMPTGSQGAKPTLPPGSSPIPGTVTTPPVQPGAPSNPVQIFQPVPPTPTEPVPPPATTPAQPAPAAPTPAPPQPAPPGPAPAAPPARIAVSPPTELRVGGGPYTVPISISGASRLSSVTISITYNPGLVRVRNVQEGTFMRQGGVAPTFVPNVNQAEGRIDIVITRPGDQTGASTQGLLAAFIVEPLTAGTGTLAVSGSGTLAGGGQAALQFAPVGITVR